MDNPLPSPHGPAAVLSNSPWGGRDTALVLEDNEGIAGLLKILLGQAGLQVSWCQSGRDALARFATQRDAIALVLSDCRLPDGDGREFCRQMREQRADLPLLFCSGSAACLNLGPLKSGRLVRFMPKPYAPAEILAQVAQLQAEARQASIAISSGFV